MEEVSENSEEKWNMWTHFCGIVFAVLAFPGLFLSSYYGMDNTKLFALTVYSVSFTFLYIASTLYHKAKKEKRKNAWRKVDHISIYFMISGTYVPFMLEYIDFTKAVIFLTIMYAIVLGGSFLKLFFTGKYEIASVILYVFLGWMIVFIWKPFYANANIEVLSMVVAGGLAYMIGVFFYMRDSRKYYHAIWHIFVLIGSIFHFSGVYLM